MKLLRERDRGFEMLLIIRAETCPRLEKGVSRTHLTRNLYASCCMSDG